VADNSQRMVSSLLRRYYGKHTCPQDQAVWGHAHPAMLPTGCTSQASQIIPTSPCTLHSHWCVTHSPW
jgi:hypothetical protein